MSLFNSEPDQPKSSTSYAEAAAIALSQRMLEAAVNTLSNSEVLGKVQDYKKAYVPMLVPALINAQAAGYVSSMLQPVIETMLSIESSQATIAEKLSDIAESLDYLAAGNSDSRS